tara:strand:+ start:1426 stop:2049 length:624 start_codon:yes stop_codon:yes gene_type:complete
MTTKEIKDTNQLKNLLQIHGISQTELAAKIGQSRINFNKIVNNQRTLNISTAKKCARIFNRQWFEMYEPIEMEMTLHGEFVHDGKDIPQIRLYNMLEDKLRKIRLRNYIADTKDLIGIYDKYGSNLWLLNKNDKTVNPDEEWGGLYFVCNNKKELFFVHYNKLSNEYRYFDPSVGQDHKTIKNIQSLKLEYSIKVLRIDFNWDWVDH